MGLSMYKYSNFNNKLLWWNSCNIRIYFRFIMAEGGDQTSNTISSNDVNEQFLATLIEMGIQQDIARKVSHLIN